MDVEDLEVLLVEDSPQVDQVAYKEDQAVMLKDHEDLQEEEEEWGEGAQVDLEAVEEV